MIIARPQFRGMGFTYYDLLASAGQEDCDPKDSACVGRNQQRANAAEDLWISKYMTDPNTANASVPNVSFVPNTSAAATQAFMNNQPVEASSYIGSTYVPPPAPAPAPAPLPSTKPPSGSNVTNSSGGQGAPFVIQNAQTGTVSSLLPSLSSSTPWYVWAIGAGVGIFALKSVFGGGR
jgi:hypothetical protein